MIPTPVMHFGKPKGRRREVWGFRVRVVGIAPTVFAADAVRRRLVEAEVLAPEEPVAVLHDFGCDAPRRMSFADCLCTHLWLVIATEDFV